MKKYLQVRAGPPRCYEPSRSTSDCRNQGTSQHQSSKRAGRGAKSETHTHLCAPSASVECGHSVQADAGQYERHQTECAEQLRPELLEAACARAGIPLTLRRHAGYDHGYWFVQSFVADHLRWHAARL